MEVEKMSKGKQRQWKANEEMREKLHEDLGSEIALKDY